MSYHRLALIGFDGPNQAMMEYCFAKAVDCELVEPSKADIILVNGDRPESHDAQQSEINSAFPKQYKIVISLYDLNWSGFSLLKKPHSPDELLNLIRTVKYEDDPKGTPRDHQPSVTTQTAAQVIRQRQGQPLKQKLMRGKLIVNAADRLVKQIEDQIKTKKEGQLQSTQGELSDKKKKAKAKAKKLERKLEKIHAHAAEVKAKKLIPLTPEQALQCCGNQPDLDISRAENRRLLYVSGEGLFLTRLLSARDKAEASGGVVEVTGLPGPFYYCPDSHIVYSWFDDDFLNQLALTRFSFGELQVHPLDLGEAAFVPDEELQAMPADAFIWKVAVWTVRGRLLTGMDPEKAYQLTHNPDFTHLLNVPHCEEISFLWNGHNLSAQDVMHILDIPQREVFSFMTGAYALGWLE